MLKNKNKTFKVLFEELRAGNAIVGRTDNNFLVQVEGSEELLGTFKEVKLLMQSVWFYMGKSFKIAFIARLVFILQWLIFLTCKKIYKGDKVDQISNVILFWHGRLALMPFAFRHFGKKGKKLML